MSQPFPKTFVVDIGRSYTDSFVVGNDKNTLVIEKRFSLPTSLGDLEFTLNKLTENLKVGKEMPKIFTGTLSEAETLAKNNKADFIPSEEALSQVKSWFGKHEFKDATILDAGSYSYSPNIKISNIGAFLTKEISEADIENYFGNKTLKPQSIPVKPTELEIEEAFYRIEFASNGDFVANKNPVINLVISGAYFSKVPTKTRLALVILDILAKGRIAQVKLDTKLFLHSFGALLKKYPEISDWEVDFFKDLGAFISFGGRGRVLLDYGFADNQEISIVEDEIALLPSPKEQKIKITFPDTKEKKKVEVTGGAFGVLLDGRTKPLKLAFGRSASRVALKRWQEAIEKVEMIE